MPTVVLLPGLARNHSGKMAFWSVGLFSKPGVIGQERIQPCKEFSIKRRSKPGVVGQEHIQPCEEFSVQRRSKPGVVGSQ